MRDRDEFPIGAWLARLLLAFLLAVAGIASYFVVPKLEAHWANLGIVPPVWSLALLQVAHLVRTFWYTLPVLMALILWPRRAAEPKDRP